MIVLQVIGWCAYFLIAFGVVCAGTFGIAATASERKLESRRLATDQKQFAKVFVEHYSQLEITRYREATIKLYYLTLWVALLWPLGIPIYLAWKKGNFIDKALAKREELQNG